MGQAYPLRTLILTVIVGLLAVPVVLRIEFDSSLESLVARDDAATAATLRVLRDFDAADDLLVLVSDDTAAPSRDALAAYARRFEAAAADDAEARTLFDAVTCRPGPDARQFVEDIIVPNGLYYLGDSQFEQLLQRLTPQGMRRQIRRTEQMLASPAPTAVAVAGDPLRLHELLADSMPRALPGAVASDAFYSDDGRAIMIRVSGQRPPTDLAFTPRFIAAVERVASAAEPGPLRVRLGGSYAISDLSHRVIRGDMIRAVVGSVILLQLLFLLVFRRWWSFVLTFIPVGLGILAGLSAFALLRSSMTPLAAGVGAILTGLAIDYAVHWLSHRALHGDSTAGRGITADLVGACVTSAAAFGAIGLSRVPALRDFALLGALGLVASLFATLIVLPAILALLAKATRQPFAGLGSRLRVEGLLAGIHSHARSCIGAGVTIAMCAALAAWACYPDDGLLDHDSDAMHPHPNEPLAVQREIAQRFGALGGALTIYLQASDPDALPGRARLLDERLSGHVRGTLSLGWLLPPPDRVAQRRATIAAVDPAVVVADFRGAIADSALDPTQFDGYAQTLARLLRPGDPPDVLDLTRYPAIARALLPRRAIEQGEAPTQALTLATLVDPLAAPEHLAGVIADVPGAHVTGLGVVGRAVERGVRAELPRLTLAAGAVVAMMLMLKFRSVTAAMLAMLPALTGALFLLATLTLTDTRLNLITLVALPLLAGIGVDYGLFTVGATRRAVAAGADTLATIAPSIHAIVICAATTIVGFGSLTLTRVPAMQSLGLAMAASIAGCCVGTMLILLPVELIRLRRGTMAR